MISSCFFSFFFLFFFFFLKFFFFFLNFLKFALKASKNRKYRQLKTNRSDHIAILSKSYNGLQLVSSLHNRTKNNLEMFVLICSTGFPVVDGDWGDPPHYPKNWLVPQCPLLLFCPKNADFVIFMQFLVILPKLSPPHQPTPFGKPWQYQSKFDFDATEDSKETIESVISNVYDGVRGIQVY